MSKGPGVVQRLILEALGRRAGRPTTLETLRWELCGNLDVENSPEKLPKKFETAFARATKGLAASLLVSIDCRKLQSFKELKEHYPGKTLSRSVRDLRLKVLPALEEFAKSYSNLGLRYSSQENEDFEIAQLCEEKRLNLANSWCGMELKLIPMFAETRDDKLLQLIVRGRKLFTKTPTDTKTGFADLVNICCQESYFPGDLEVSLRTIIREFISEDRTGELRLKSVIHTIADVPAERTSGPCTLKKRVLEELHFKHKELVESLPGFKPCSVPMFLDHKHSPGLIGILDRTVFSNYSFLSLNLP